MNLHPIFADVLGPFLDAPAKLAAANNRSLARIIGELINEHEPLLKAETDGATVIVRERGGPAVMRVTVEVA